MRLFKMMLITLILGGVGILAPGCSSGSAPPPEGQVVTVQRGNLSVNITGVGNLAFSQTVDLPFEIDGTVSEVLVEAGDSVKEGQVMAKLDISTWQDQVTALENNVTAAERSVTAKERAVTQAQRNVTSKENAVTQAQRNVTAKEEAVTAAERNVTAKERAVTQAQRNVTDAERKVTQAERGVTGAEQNVVAKKRDLLQAQINLNNALLSLEQTEETSTDPLEIEIKQLAVELAQGNLADAQQAVEDASTTGIADAQQAVEDAKQAVEDAKQAVEDAQQDLEDASTTGIADAQQAVEDAQQAVEDAKQAVDDANTAMGDAQTAVGDAQAALDQANQALADAKSASPEVKAPFDGLVTNVNVTGGQDLKKGTVAVTIADPTKFEASVMVSELNILKVRVGGPASVQVEALQVVSIPATVSFIAPSATIQSSVVNYQVKVQLAPLSSITSNQTLASNNSTSGNTSTGNFSQLFGQMPGSSNLTQEQIDQLRQQRQTGQLGGQFQQTISAANVQLVQGLTVTVSITTAQANNVLLVPTQAIISAGGQTSVQMLVNGVTESRQVQTGISNSQYTEITSGLNEGDQVLVPQSSTQTSSSSGTQQTIRQPGGIIFGR